MVNYENGKIYKIINKNNEIIYIGSTVNTLCRRFSTHKHRGGGNKIILIEDCPCSCKEQLVRKEQEYIEQYSELLNKCRAYNSKEYYKEYNKEYKKEYYNKNKEKRKEKDKERYQKNKEEISKKAKEYYKKKLKEKVKCDLCNAEVSKQNLKRHQKFKICINNRL